MPMFTKSQLYAANGTKKSTSLFKETATTPTSEPIMSLAPTGYGKYICLQDLYVALTQDDPSEYTFAEEVFGSYAFWHNIRQKEWFKPYYEDYQIIAAAKRKQKAFKAIIAEVESEGRNALAASKYLIEEPWKGKKVVDKEAKENSRKSTVKARNSKEVDSDYQRLKEQGLLQ